jgi:hypothetical protein
VRGARQVKILQHAMLSPNYSLYQSSCNCRPFQQQSLQAYAKSPCKINTFNTCWTRLDVLGRAWQSFHNLC